MQLIPCRFNYEVTYLMIDPLLDEAHTAWQRSIRRLLICYESIPDLLRETLPRETIESSLIITLHTSAINAPLCTYCCIACLMRVCLNLALIKFTLSLRLPATRHRCYTHWAIGHYKDCQKERERNKKYPPPLLSRTIQKKKCV